MLTNPDPKTASVLKLPVHLHSNYSSWLIERLHQGAGAHVVTLNAEMAILAEQNFDIANIIRQAELVIPDGAGVVFYLRMRGQRQQRCPGIELAQSLIERLGKFGETYPIVFYGGKPGVAEQAAQMWRKRIPEISIVTNHGYLSPQEEDDWEKTLVKLQPKVILVALGVPRQELWIRDRRSLCPNAIWIGVGGSFDIWSGTKTRAPAWLRDNNLEWLYRLYQEPWRWKRMQALPQFFWRALLVKERPHS
jgi:N-acetylglucosaminyldiphosphoundecaprenol N-acetyl-beta-D-mannosaminyltransferase